ncbi:MAG: flagellar export chaperone FliS [Phycisphaerae bacterium]
MSADGIAAYKQNSVTTQSRGRIVVMLYEGAVRFLKKTIEAMEAGDVEQRVLYLNKACDIILELNVSLDMEVGGEIAENLRNLYMFMIRHLNTAHAKNDTAKVREVIGLMEELNEGWKAITA